MGAWITRFAPSPTGYLHPGHAYSALYAFLYAQKTRGTFHVRIEDIDPVRCDPHYIPQIYEDLSWLGLAWTEPVRQQSKHLPDYKHALSHLNKLGVLYPCFCTRKEIQTEIEHIGHAAHGHGLNGPEGAHYPGTCKNLDSKIRDQFLSEKPYALRIDMGKALSLPHARNLTWYDLEKGMQIATPQILGDVVLARKDIMTSYHLSVVVDDALQGITLVTRGEDLFYASHLHRLLQALLGLPVPTWAHHHLITDPETGQRYAKSNHSISLKNLRAKGISAQEIINHFGLNS